MFMNKPAKPIVDANSPAREPEKATQNDVTMADGMLTPSAIEALADIAKRTTHLVRLHAEKLKEDDSYQVIDPRTVATTFQEFVQTAQVNSAQLVKEQFRLWSDVTLLWQKTASHFLFNTPVDPVISPAPQDKRFKNELWVENCFFDYVKQYYLLMSRYIQESIHNVDGVDPHTHHKTEFYTRQFISALSPTNFPVTNPVVLKSAIASRGENLIKGLRNLVEDIERGGGRLNLKMSDLSDFQFGKNIATSPGKVIFQNELMQLIQYAPSTQTVHQIPLLIV